MTSPTQDASERAEFEKWARSLNVNVSDRDDGGDYYWPFAQAAWQAWQARAALSAPQDSGWQPIDTAPKDGTRVLIALWAWNQPNTERLYYWAEFCEGEWCEPDNLDIQYFAPTHWRPLPPPPGEQQEGK
jgi:hypothetical protein